MEEDKKKSRRKFFELGIKFGLLATVGSVAAVEAMDDEDSNGMVELMSTDGNIIQVPASEAHEVSKSPKGYDPRVGFPGKKFVMVVDLAKCTNALKCQEACNKGHYITGDNAWLK